MVVTDELASRYGRSRTRSRRDRWWIAGVALAFVAVFTAWVVWAGLDDGAGSLEATDTAHTIVDAHTVSVSFSINVAPGTPVNCALEAMNETFTIVGWKVFSYPATTQRVTAHTETLRTTELSNSGLIYRCWLA
ncbi:hypothetical protein ASC63_09565 [Leifsonia sp. Root112D2]|nr:hypothetical protein ASC63_09565 [Leifsonia sp. Root112D2]